MYFLFKGYHDVLELPAGASNIAIDTNKSSHNVIGKSSLLNYHDIDSTAAAYTTKFELNGPDNRSYQTGVTYIAGSYWAYSHHYLYTNGPINQTVTIKV